MQRGRGTVYRDICVILSTLFGSSFWTIT